MGAIDANGIYQFDETDDASPFSDLLNLLADSTSDKVALLVAAINALGGPFRIAAGSVVVTLAGGTNTNTAAVALPAGRFTVTPLMWATAGSSFGAFCSATAGSLTAGTVRASTPSNVGGSTPITCQWLAIQMTSGSAAG